jgi:glutamate-1-semialdehyde aminotransferase
MALGAVALGYGHPAVTEAAVQAAREGVVGSLPPVLEERVALELRRCMPWVEQVRFLKTGAEAFAAAIISLLPAA